MNLQNSGEVCREIAEVYPLVMPAQAGIQYSEAPRLNRELAAYWIPAVAGMTAAGGASTSPSLRGALATKQSSFLCSPWIASLRSQ
jgi:hypothetical protein